VHDTKEGNYERPEDVGGVGCERGVVDGRARILLRSFVERLIPLSLEMMADFMLSERMIPRLNCCNV